MIHKVKSWPEQFKAVTEKGKRFEVRKNDRGYGIGDTLILQEWDPRTKDYSGWEARLKITHILQGEFGLPKDLAVLQIEEIEWAERRR